MARARGSREISIFNFSFLDILACTVGALTFVLVMVVVINIGSLPGDLVERLEELGREVEEGDALARVFDMEKARFLEAQDRVDALEKEKGLLEGQRGRLARDLAESEAEAEVARQMLQDLQGGSDESAALGKRIDDLTGEVAAAQARAGELERRLADERARAEALEEEMREAGVETGPRVAPWLLSVVLFAALMGLWRIYQHLRWKRIMRRMRERGMEPAFVPIDKAQRTGLG